MENVQKSQRLLECWRHKDERRNVNTELDYISVRVFNSALQSLIIIQTHQYHYIGLTTFSSDKPVAQLSGW